MNQDQEAAHQAARRHRPRLVTSAEAASQIHGEGPVGRFNRAFALFVTRNVGTMYCAYLFAIVALFGLVGIITSNLLLAAVVTWVSQAFLQLVLLPVIIVGQNVQQEATDQRANADHQTLTALHALNVHQLEILETMQKILEELRAQRKPHTQAGQPSP
jgi:hypothetical protein